MSTKKSTNPMQYRVKSASGSIRRSFRNRDSAEKYFKQIQIESPSEVIVFEDVFANTIIDSYYPKENVPTSTSGYISTDKVATTSFSTTTNAEPDVVYHYRDGKLIKEVIEVKEESKFVQFIKKIFKRRRSNP